jgi:hypothetical protein
VQPVTLSRVSAPGYSTGSLCLTRSLGIGPSRWPGRPDLGQGSLDVGGPVTVRPCRPSPTVTAAESLPGQDQVSQAGSTDGQPPDRLVWWRAGQGRYRACMQQFRNIYFQKDYFRFHADGRAGSKHVANLWSPIMLYNITFFGDDMQRLIPIFLVILCYQYNISLRDSIFRSR